MILLITIYFAKRDILNKIALRIFVCPSKKKNSIFFFCFLKRLRFGSFIINKTFLTLTLNLNVKNKKFQERSRFWFFFSIRIMNTQVIRSFCTVFHVYFTYAFSSTFNSIFHKFHCNCILFTIVRRKQRNIIKNYSFLLCMYKMTWKEHENNTMISLSLSLSLCTIVRNLME